MSDQNLGRAILEIGIKDTDLKSGLSKSKTEVENFVSSAKSTFGSMGSVVSSGIRGIGTAASGSLGAIGNLVNGLGKIGLAAGGIKTIEGTIAGLGKTLTGGNAQFETYGVSIQTLIKNSDDFKNKYKNVTDPLQLQAKAAEEAQVEMKRLADFGASTPFDLPQVVEASTTLRGFGLSADNTKQRFGYDKDEILKLTGDLAAGTNTDFKEMALDIGKFSSGATGEAISRFQELGVTTRSELEKMGLQFDKSGALIVKNQEEMDKATGILMTAIKNKYGGLMDAQSSTLSGMLSNLDDWKSGVLRQVTQPLFEPLKDGLKSFLDFAGSDAGKKAIQKVTDAVQSGVDYTLRILRTATTDVKLFFDAFTGKEVDSSSLSGFQKTLVLIADVITQIVIPGIKSLWQEFGPLIKQVKDVVEAFSPFSWILTAIQGYMTGGLPGAMDALGLKFTQLGTAVSGILTTLGDELVKHGPEILAKLGEIGSNILSWIANQLPILLAELGKWGKAFIDWIGPQIPPLLAELGKLAVAALSWLGEQIPKIVEGLAKWGSEFVAWIEPKIPGMLAELAKLITNALGWVGEQIPKIVEQLAKWGKEFVDWIQPQIGPMLQELGKFLGQITGWIIGHIPDIIGKLTQWGLAFIGWVATDVIPKLPGVLADILKGILAFIGSALPQIVDGIGKWVSGILEKAGELITSLPDTLHKAFDAGVLAVGNFILDASKKISELPGKLLAGIGDLGGLLINAGKSLIDGFIKGIQSIHIPLPHIKVDVQWGDILGVPVPKPNVSVDWYAKGGIFNSPNLIGVGEAGAEAVLPLAKIKPLFAEAISELLPNINTNNNNSRTSTVNNSPTYILNVDKALDSTSIINDFQLLQSMA